MANHFATLSQKKVLKDDHLKPLDEIRSKYPKARSHFKELPYGCQYCTQVSYKMTRDDAHTPIANENPKLSILIEEHYEEEHQAAANAKEAQTRNAELEKEVLLVDAELVHAKFRQTDKPDDQSLAAEIETLTEQLAAARANADAKQVTIADVTVPVSYMNSSAAIKGFTGEHGGTICTSSNAKRALTWAQAQE